MARPKKFEKERVLEEAMRVFWRQGYRETTMEDITDSTGLKPGSLYGMFNDKEGLFEEALEHYRQTVILPRVEILTGDGSVEFRLRSFLRDVVDRTTRENRPLGCIITNSSFEIDLFSAGIQQRIRTSMTELKDALRTLFEEAEEHGGGPQQDPEQLAETVLALVNGLNVLGRTFQDPDQLRRITETALNNLLPLNREVHP